MLPATSRTQLLPVASRFAAMSSGNSHDKCAGRGCMPRSADHTAYAHHSDQPTCRLGMAVWWLGLVQLSWDAWSRMSYLATMSTTPDTAIRGGDIGTAQ